MILDVQFLPALELGVRFDFKIAKWQDFWYFVMNLKHKKVLFFCHNIMPST